METSSFSVSSSQAVMIEVASFFKSSLTAGSWMHHGDGEDRVFDGDLSGLFGRDLRFHAYASEALESFCVSTSEDPAFEASV